MHRSCLKRFLFLLNFSFFLLQLLKLTCTHAIIKQQSHNLHQVSINGFATISRFYVTATSKVFNYYMQVLNETIRFAWIGNFTSIIPGATTAQADLNKQTNIEDNANRIKLTKLSIVKYNFIFVFTLLFRFCTKLNSATKYVACMK